MIESIIIVLLIIVVLVFLFLYLIHPEQKRYYDWLINRNFAHRGLYTKDQVIPENSVPAFIRAVTNNYGIELDVQLTKDKVVVVFHDENLKRMCNVDKNLSDLTFNELQHYYLGNSKQTIPTLRQVLDIVSGKVPMYIEIKSSKVKGIDELCYLTNELLKKYDGDYGICSFNPFALLWYKDNRPSILRMLIIQDYSKTDMNIFKKIILQYGLSNFITKPNAISYEYNKTNITYKLCKAMGAYGMGWAIGCIEEYYKYVNNFDSVIFEFFKPTPYIETKIKKIN